MMDLAIGMTDLDILERKYSSSLISSNHVEEASGLNSELGKNLSETFRILHKAVVENPDCDDSFKWDTEKARDAVGDCTGKLHKVIKCAGNVLDEKCGALLGLAVIADQAGFDSQVSGALVSQLIAPTIRDLMMVREMLQEAAR